MAGALITLTLPVMAVVALAIKCESRGPVFVWEERRGALGRQFAALTFRTTVHDSRTSGADLTQVGCFLEYTRMDCLPQLINVLRGEMTCISANAELPFFLD